MKKVILAITLSVIVCMGSVVGCTSQSPSTTTTPAETSTDGADTKAEEPKTETKTASGKPVEIKVWGINTMSVGSGSKEMIDAFNNTHDNIVIKAESTPNAGGYETQDLTKLTAAISAGNAPDVAVLNAPFIMEVASRNVLEPLDEVIARSGVDFNQFYEYTIKEMTFDGKIWGIPNGVDTRFLYYNKDHFAEAGLDPEQPPKTWDELLDYAVKLTKTDSSGEMSQIGFIPNFGNSWLYLYLLQNGGQFVSEDGKTCTLNDPKVVQALDFMVKGYDLVGGATKINSYVTAFNQQQGANDPFLKGQVSMIINGNWAIGTYARYGQDMMDKIGYAYAPTPTGTDFITWSGGWSYGIPKGCKNIDEAFEVATWLATEGVLEQAKGQSAYNKENGLLDIPPNCASKVINEELFKLYVDPMESQHIKDMLYFGMDILQNSYALPANPLGQLLWSEHARAIDNAIYKKMTSQEALDEATKKCQEEINQFWSSYTPSN